MMMDRIRDARRASMAGVNGGLSRRRQRSSLRDSPEEDGAMEMQEMGRLRDRGSKKDRDRDRSNRSKRRRGDRMMHGSHREEGEESSEESVDEEDDDEDDDASMSVRPPHPSAQNPPPLASVVQNHQMRRGYPAKPVRPPGSCTWKVSEEMIGAPIPRKARSSSVKRSQECWVSGGVGGDGGAEQVHRQASTSPARPSPSSTAPVSPSSSNASVRKKMKTIGGTKHRPPKNFKSPSIQEIEIEVAEVLFGMTRQVPPKLENHKHNSKESNGIGNEANSKISSPVPISSPATSQPSAAPSNPSSSSTLLTTTAPKRKRPRMRLDEESPTSLPVSVVLPAASEGKLEAEALAAGGSKAIDASPISENNTASPVIDNGGILFDPAISNISSNLASPTKMQQDSVKQERNSTPDLKDSDIQAEKKTKEETVSPPKESPLDVNLEEPPASKAVVVSESPREEKFSIDLMAPPGKSSAEMENTTADMKMVAKMVPAAKSFAGREDISVDMKMTPRLVISKVEGEKMEKKLNPEPKEIAMDDRNVVKLSTLEFDSKNHACKERNLDLQPDLEKHQTLKQDSRIPRAETFTNKSGPTASLPMPMQITGWPGGFPSFGYMGQVPPLPPVVPVDGSASSSKTLQQSFFSPHLRPKRCATHCYIAQNVLYHQQIARLNTFWPAAAGVAPLYASKQYNLNTMPASDSAILGSPLQGSGRNSGSIQEKGIPATTAHSGPSIKEMNNLLIDASQRKSQMLQQPAQPCSAGNMLAPAFVFPLNQQQAAAAGAVAANRPVVAKLMPATGSAAQSSSGASYAAVGASGTGGPGSTMSFNYPGLPPNEAQYLAFLQNNAYSFPIPAHVGGAPPPYRGAPPAQNMPFFNVSFYPSQMLHPSQLRLPQQPPSSQQPLYSQQGHQNPSTSSGSSSSHRNTQQSQKVSAAGASTIAAGNSHGFPPSKQPRLPHQARQTISETGGEDAPSTPDSRVLQDQKNIFTHKFAMPAHSQNFSLIAPATAPLSTGVGNHSEKHPQHQTQNQVMKMDLTPSQAFAMSFASFGGAAAAAAGGAAPNGLDFSSTAQNHALLQTLPEAARHGYQISAAAAAHTAQQQQQKKKCEDGRSAADLGNSSTPGEEGKVSSMIKALGNAQQHSLTFSKVEKDAPISSIIGSNLMDSCSRTLNLIQPPPGGGTRLSSRPGSAAPAAFSGTPTSQASNSLHLQPQQYQQQVLQLQKQEQQRAKQSSSHSNAAVVYGDRLPSNSNASKFPQALVGFPPTLIQGSTPTQSPQRKASPRAATPSTSSAPSLPASPSVKNQISLQQQVRSPQPPGHQTQISFGVNPAKAAGQAAQHLSEGGHNAASLSSPAAASSTTPNSVSKNLGGGSPHPSSAAKLGQTPLPSLPVLPFQKQPQIGKSSPSSSSAVTSSLPTTSRNMPSILGNPHINPAASSGSKPQPPSQYLPPHQLSKQPFPQPQFFFSNPYMQAQASQTDAATAAAAYFQQHQQRRPPEQQQNSNSGAAGPSSSLTLAGGGSAAPEQFRGARAAPASNSKASTSAGHVQHHPAQLATVSQFGSGAAHPLMSAAAAAAAFPYIHTMQSVPVKPPATAAAGDQKPAAGR